MFELIETLTYVFFPQLFAWQCVWKLGMSCWVVMWRLMPWDSEVAVLFVPMKGTLWFCCKETIETNSPNHQIPKYLHTSIQLISLLSFPSTFPAPPNKIRVIFLRSQSGHPTPVVQISTSLCHLCRPWRALSFGPSSSLLTSCPKAIVHKVNTCFHVFAAGTQFNL